MFAINHAATALIIKKAFPDAPIAVLLVSVQLVEIFWVALNFLGIEKTRTKDEVRTVKDVELAYMPFSHSIASTTVLALGAWTLIVLGFGRVDLGAAVALGIASHLVLDLISHARDIALVPLLSSKKIGMGLYENPAVAFVFETAYGILVDLRGEQCAPGYHCSLQSGKCVAVPESAFGTGEVPGAPPIVDYGSGCFANYRDGGACGDIQLKQCGYLPSLLSLRIGRKGRKTWTR
jgi:hypothetical protein